MFVFIVLSVLVRVWCLCSISVCILGSDFMFVGIVVSVLVFFLICCVIGVCIWVSGFMCVRIVVSVFDIRCRFVVMSVSCMVWVVLGVLVCCVFCGL